MNPEIYDDNLKEQKHFDANANSQEPHEFTKEELVALKEKIKNGIEKIQTDMDWNDVVNSYVNGSDEFCQEVLNILRESVKANNLPEEEYLKQAEYLEMRRKLKTRSR